MTACMTMFNNLDVDKDFNLDVDFKISLESRVDFEVGNNTQPA